jgi:hypothetical protein
MVAVVVENDLPIFLMKLLKEHDKIFYHFLVFVVVEEV